jgi:transposase
MNKLEEFVKSTEGETRKVLEELVYSMADVIKQNKILQQRIDYYKYDIRLLKKKIFGSSSEKIITGQQEPSQKDLYLFNEFELVSQQVELDLAVLPTIESIPSTKKKSGRKRLPAHLPRITIEHDLQEEEKNCHCGSVMECIGTQTSEELEYIPAVLNVIEHRCKKYICADCVRNNEENNLPLPVGSKTAKKPPQLIEKSFASPSLLAHIAVAKFCDHLPLYRQEQIFHRLSIDLSRQTMSLWMLKVGQAITPLINLMQDEVLNYRIAFADETTVQVLNESNRRAQTKSFMWCFIGGSPDKRSIIYQYHPTREGKVAEQFFEGFQGALHCDGYGGYNALIKSQHIIAINCFAHVRRKFVEALPDGKQKGVAGYVVSLIRLLYKIEANLKTQQADRETIKDVRQQQAKPLLEQLKTYLDEKVNTTLPSSKVGQAIDYTLKRWPYLNTYLMDGEYEIDNNRSERAIKPFTCGRKNWLFANCVEGANASAKLFSLIETAKAHQLNPVAYFTHIFKELPACRILADYEALLPFNTRDPCLKISP